MNKKVISAALASVMALSTLGTSVFAADKTIKTAGATTYKVSATLAAPEINVTLPGTIAAVVNPYGVSFEMKGQTYGAQGVTSPAYTIVNNTTASAVSVTATATLTVPTTTNADKSKSVTIQVVDEASKIDDENQKDPKDKENPQTPKKSIFAVVRGAANPSAVEVTKLPGTVDPTSKKVVADLALFPVGSADELTGMEEIKFVDVTLSTKEAPITGTPTNLMVIPKAIAAKVDADGKETTAKKVGFGQFQLGGNVTDTKKTPWTSADKISINLVLDIGPAAGSATD